MFCSKCGKRIENASYKFCRFCGEQLELIERESTPRDSDSAINEKSQNTAKQKEKDSFSSTTLILSLIVLLSVLLNGIVFKWTYWGHLLFLFSPLVPILIYLWGKKPKPKKISIFYHFLIVFIGGMVGTVITTFERVDFSEVEELSSLESTEDDSPEVKI